MKKIALTSLLAVFAVSGANAAVINNNPLYRADAGMGYNVFEVASHSENISGWTVADEFGYSFTDRLAVKVATSASMDDAFDHSAWDTFGFGVDYRVLDDVNWKADVYGHYGLGPVWGDHRPFLDEDDTTYNWNVGMRLGYVAETWTVAGHVEFDYRNAESFNWGDDGAHMITAGLDAQLMLCPQWNLTAGVEYTGLTDSWADNAGHWTGELGVNYNLDMDKFIGLYVNADLDDSTGDWKMEDGFGFGAKFGIQF